MKLLELSAWQLAINLIGIGICIAIGFCAICRVNAARYHVGKVTPIQAQYIAMAVWALGNALALVRGQVIEFWDAGAAITFAIHLALTFEYWRDLAKGAPVCEGGGVEC